MITINPATLDDDALWSFNDLRALCKQLHLGGRGKRVELVERLQTWNKLRVHDRAALALTETHADADPSLESWIPLNVEGSNFSILHQVRATSPCLSVSVRVCPCLCMPLSLGALLRVSVRAFPPSH